MNLSNNTGDYFIKEGLSENFFIHRENLSAHIVTSNFPMARILACFPDENSGIALMFDSKMPENNGISISFSSLPSISVQGKKRGVFFSVRTDKQKMIITNICLDSIRFIRSLKYPGGVEDVMKHRKEFLHLTGLPEEGFLYPSFESIMENGRRTLNFHRMTPDEKNNFFCSISVDSEEMDLDADGERVVFSSLKGKSIEFQVYAGMDFAPLTPYMPGEILNNRAEKFLRHLKKNNPDSYVRHKKNLDSLAFLSYREKFLAGSWRFLTYFGRDTMMSLMMLKDCINTEVYESGIQSVLDRLSQSGAVAHEEDTGCWAMDFHIGEYVRLMKDSDEKKSAIKKPFCREETVGGNLWRNLSSPVFDYKMVDDDFMLPLMVDYFTNDEDITQQQKKDFFNRINDRDERNIVTLLRNFNYIISKTEKYSETGDPAFLIKINDGIEVGDWRDSGAGLGWGRYPGSINVSLVRNSLKAIKRIMESGICCSEELTGISNKYNLKNLSIILKNPDILKKHIESWKEAGKHFVVKLSPEEVKTRITHYLKTSPIENEERELFLSTIVEKDMTVREFLESERVPELLKSGLNFYALSLDENLKAVEVMNSDMGFSLFFGEPEPEEIEDMLKVINLPYPLGLAQPGGIVVANPAFSHNRHLWRALDENAYHGRVVWAWQMFLMEMGLCRQIRKYRGEPVHREFTEKMLDSLKKLRKWEETAGELSQWELWTHEVVNGEIKPVAYGMKTTSETESNPVQLWSTVGIAVMMEVDGILGMRGE